ncbi:MAG TPA: alpha-hydroxy acid oxidase [Bryobacteraceae bacterium]|jgi:4-hydroxymandelate oxidase|nr:alpha-hydroxy acid oxidase [Bryobacteraceae bacterium]
MLEQPQLEAVQTLDDFEALAKSHLTHRAYEFVTGAAGDEVTAAENRAAFRRTRLEPRVLVDVSRTDTSVTLFGRRHAHPILLAPTGYHKLFHDDGEAATVRGANLGEATLIAAAFATTSIEEMAAVATRPMWFQLYIHRDRGVTRELVERAERAGCEAICVTVDVPSNGPRDRELRAGFVLPPGVQRVNLADLEGGLAASPDRPFGRSIYSMLRSSSATWADLEWLRSFVKTPLLVKGVLHPADAERAVACGCDGVIVSNHGGRTIDTVTATLDAFPRIVERVGGRTTLLLDGGVRRGTDVFKAIAMGAAAVCIGRPYLYGLAVGGELGIARVLEILRSELEMTMCLVGCPELGRASREWIGEAGA